MCHGISQVASKNFVFEFVTAPTGRKVAQELNRLAIAPEDTAQAVLYALDRSANVTINDVIVSPTKQNG